MAFTNIIHERGPQLQNVSTVNSQRILLLGLLAINRAAKGILCTVQC